jgi:hypothetical protein
VLLDPQGRPDPEGNAARPGTLPRRKSKNSSSYDINSKAH